MYLTLKTQLISIIIIITQLLLKWRKCREWDGQLDWCSTNLLLGWCPALSWWRRCWAESWSSGCTSSSTWWPLNGAGLKPAPDLTPVFFVFPPPGDETGTYLVPTHCWSRVELLFGSVVVLEIVLGLKTSPVWTHDLYMRHLSTMAKTKELSEDTRDTDCTPAQDCDEPIYCICHHHVSSAHSNLDSQAMADTKLLIDRSRNILRPRAQWWLTATAVFLSFSAPAAAGVHRNIHARSDVTVVCFRRVWDVFCRHSNTSWWRSDVAPTWLLASGKANRFLGGASAERNNRSSFFHTVAEHQSIGTSA